jgi:hypothetical protein
MERALASPISCRLILGLGANDTMIMNELAAQA